MSKHVLAAALAEQGLDVLDIKIVRMGTLATNDMCSAFLTFLGMFENTLALAYWFSCAVGCKV